ncbi:MAG: hypothetical protein ACFFD2_14070, partial [Promethearchaeota archaeon]
EDIGGFLKRAEKKYAEYIGESKAQMLINALLKTISEIPDVHRNYLGSDISKYLFKYSTVLSDLSPENIERTLKSALMFTHTLTELKDMNRAEINQFIINRSQHRIRNLLDLFKGFLEKNKEFMIKTISPNFDDILIYTLGEYINPKIIEEAPHIHEIMETYHKKFPIAKEHAKWGRVLYIILQRYLEILENEDGNRLIEQLWNFTLPNDQIIEYFHEKIAEIPREDETIFLTKLMNLLARQILIDKNIDRNLTGSVAYLLLAKNFIKMFGGCHVLIRAIKINQLLKERKDVDLEEKKEIDYRIEKIVEEDLKSIKIQYTPIRTIISIINLKSYNIKFYDILNENVEYPEEITHIFIELDPLKDLLKENRKALENVDMLKELKSFYNQVELVRKFYGEFTKESHSMPTDTIENVKILRKFIDVLLRLDENLEPTSFFIYPVMPTDHLIYIFILKYLSEPLQKFFDIIQIIEQNMGSLKGISMIYYLSEENLAKTKNEAEKIEKTITNIMAREFTEDSQKIKWLKETFARHQVEIKTFQILTKFLTEFKRVHGIIEIRIKFCKTLFSFLTEIKKVHINLPAALHQYLHNLIDFEIEIDKIIAEIKRLCLKEIISPKEMKYRNDAAIKSKQKLRELALNPLFDRFYKFCSTIEY